MIPADFRDLIVLLQNETDIGECGKLCDRASSALDLLLRAYSKACEGAQGETHLSTEANERYYLKIAGWDDE